MTLGLAIMDYDKIPKHEKQNKKQTHQISPKLKTFVQQRHYYKKIKRQHTEGKKVFANHIPDKGLKSKIHKELTSLSIKKPITWNSAQCYVEAWIRGEFGGGWVHVYVQLHPFAETVIGYTLVQNKKFKQQKTV